MTLGNNTGSGIHIGGASSVDIANSTITNNTGDGIAKIGTGVGSHFNSNTIHTNGGLAIDLLDNGVTVNDVNDADAGPNNLQNFPVINYVRRGDGAANFTLNAANGTYRIQFYANAACDASGRGEGEVLISTQNVTVAGGTFTGFSAALPFGAREQITAIATSDPNNNGNFDDDGNTSEFSACRAVNTLPTVTAQAISRQQGSSVSNSQIATVADPDQPLNTLAVTVNGGATATVNGVTVSNIAVSAAGVVTADVVASCSAATANFTLRVTDAGGAFTETTLTVGAAANSAPTVGTFANTTVANSGAATVTPSAAPGDNGTFTASVSASAGFTGTLAINQTTGAVTVGSARPAGTFTITTQFTDNCNAVTTQTFTLTVNAAPPTAAAVSLGGRVTTPRGRGVFAVSMTITDQSGRTQTTRTGPLGYYRFSNLAAGETYYVSAKGKRYRFGQPTFVVLLNEDTNNINFVSQ